jgi:Family of unknown function (DUF5926)/SEC-C motif
MSRKKSARKPTRPPTEAQGAPHPRQPCPCGSGRRYRSCHGAGDDVIVARPLAGLAAECELVALREFVPSATAPAPLAEPDGSRTALIASVLPGAIAAMVREDGTALLGLQVQARSGDLSSDLGRALHWALTAEPGTALTVVGPGAASATTGGPSRLQDLLAADAELAVTVHADFGWWLTEDDPGPELAAAVQGANELIKPTEAVVAERVRAAYWVDRGSKAHLRWVRPEPEDVLLAALARLRAGGRLDLGDGSRYAGMFRAHGLLVPVWDLDRERHAKEWAGPAAEFARRLEATVESIAETPLDDAERRAREALAGGQVTVR